MLAAYHAFAFDMTIDPRSRRNLNSFRALFLVMLVVGCTTRRPEPSTVSNSLADASMAAASPVQPARSSVAPDPLPTEVAIQSGPYKLRAFVVRPAGDGPFPAVVYNHGSEREIDITAYDSMSAWWQAQGYAVVYPFRRGSGGSPGPYWRDVSGEPDSEEGKRAAVAQLEVDNADVVAAIAWAREQPFVDAHRVAVAGCSFGGIHALLAGERDTGARAVLDFAGASITWATWAPMRDRMRQAARVARVPVFFLQAENDFDTAPSRELAEEMQRAGKPHRMRIFPPHGKTQRAGHGGFCLRGMPKWGDDVRAFLDETFAN